jgi:hypothetical protein
METLVFVHDRLTISILLFTLILGVWGLWIALRGPGITPSYWGSLVIGELLIIVQSVIGVVLMIMGGWPARGWLHVLYGIVALLCFPAAFAFTRGRTSRYEALIYAVIAFFLAGITSRAQYTGGGL